MAHIREIKRRLKSASSIHQITKAMKMVASARLKRAQQRIFGARPYSDRMASVIRRLAANVSSGSHPLLKTRGEGREALLVVAADRGLCGSFNSNVFRRAQAFLKEKPDAVILAVGKKARDFFRRRRMDVRQDWVQVFPEVSSETISQIRDTLVALYTREGVKTVTVIYTEFKNVMSQKVAREILLPLRLSDAKGAGEARAADPPLSGAYLFEPGERIILDALLSQHLFIRVRRVLLESFASEMGAKRNAMESATKNASQMIGRLTLEFNRARQAMITKELAEIVGGAEALK
ncbi:MAG TPA: ATP synthase F1 subunit gamma [bacterium]|nr:ATP synthase F1 subunit gamma [bacterium]